MSGSLPVEHAILHAFCVRHDILKLSLFGSQLNCGARPDSDIDLLVEFEENHTPGLLALSAMEAELSDLLGNATVDLRTPHELSRYIRDEVVRTAEVQVAR